MTGSLPDSMIGYATQGLAELLGELSTRQRAAIDRIVNHVYIRNRPMSELLRGDDKIAAENAFYRRAKFDSDGQIVKKGGWHHDPQFQAALKEAVRLALTARTREELHAIAESKRRARMATDSVIGTVIRIATDSPMAQDKDRIAAASVVLKYAEIDEKAAASEEATDEVDWWSAVDE